MGGVKIMTKSSPGTTINDCDWYMVLDRPYPSTGRTTEVRCFVIGCMRVPTIEGRRSKICAIWGVSLSQFTNLALEVVRVVY